MIHTLPDLNSCSEDIRKAALAYGRKYHKEIDNQQIGADDFAAGAKWMLEQLSNKQS